MHLLINVHLACVIGECTGKWGGCWDNPGHYIVFFIYLYYWTCSMKWMNLHYNMCFFFMDLMMNLHYTFDDEFWWWIAFDLYFWSGWWMHDFLDDGLHDLVLMMNCMTLLTWWTWIHNITCLIWWTCMIEVSNDELAW